MSEEKKELSNSGGSYGQPVRLYSKATFVGYPQNRHNQKNSVHILKIDGVHDRKDTDFYLGKRVAYIYRCKRAVKKSRYRVIWGKIRRAHGNSGAVRASFRNNLPSKALGATLRVMLYPSRV